MNLANILEWYAFSLLKIEDMLRNDFAVQVFVSCLLSAYVLYVKWDNTKNIMLSYII